MGTDDRRRRRTEVDTELDELLARGGPEDRVDDLYDGDW